MMHPILWRLLGFILFMLLAWLALTLFLMLPKASAFEAPWQVSGVWILRFSAAVAGFGSAYLGVSWLIKPAEQS